MLAKAGVKARCVIIPGTIHCGDLFFYDENCKDFFEGTIDMMVGFAKRL